MTKSIIGTGTNLPSGRTALNSNFDELYASYVFLSGATPAPVGDGATDDSAALANAHTTAGLVCEVVIKSPATSYFLNTTATYAAAQRIQRGAVLKIGTTKTVTFTGPLVDGLHRMFDTSAATAAVSFVGNNFVPFLRPEWWGAVAGTDTAPIAALNGAAMAACMVAHVASGIPMLLRSGAVYYTDRELQATAGYYITASAPPYRATVKISSTVTAGSVRSCIRLGHSSAGSVGDQGGLDSIFFDANFRAVHFAYAAGWSLSYCRNIKGMHALNHGIRFKPAADGGGASINDGLIFENVWLEDNGTIYASPGVVANYSSDHTTVQSLTGATIDTTSTVTAGKSVFTMNGHDINNLTYLETLAPIRTGTGANRRHFWVDSWNRVSATQATITCWVANATNSSDNQPITLTGQDFAIGCGNNSHEDTHNDNNLLTFKGGISRSPAGHSFRFAGLYGSESDTVQCDQQMFSAYSIGTRGVGMYGVRIKRMYVEPTGQVIHRRAGVVFAVQDIQVDLSADGMSAGAQSAGEGHWDYPVDGTQIQGYVDDALGRSGMGNNSFGDFSWVSVGSFVAPFKANGGLITPSFQAVRTAGITLTNPLAGTTNAFDSSAGALTVTLDSALTVGGWWIIQKTDSSVNPVQITGGGCTVNGQSFYNLTRQGQSVMIEKGVSTAYRIVAVAGRQPVQPGAVVATAGAQTAAVGALTGASEKVIARYSGINAATLTTRTATQMFAEQPGALVGDSYELEIFNSSAGVTTLGAGAGVTLTGTMTIAAGTSRRFVVTFTSTTTLTIESYGTGA